MDRTSAHPQREPEFVAQCFFNIQASELRLNKFAQKYEKSRERTIGKFEHDRYTTEAEGCRERTHQNGALQARLGIEKTNVLVDIETGISRNLKGLGAIENANAVRKKSLAGVETEIWFFETQPRREREPDC